MTERQLDRAWDLYRAHRRVWGSNGYSNDQWWTACVKQAREGR